MRNTPSIQYVAYHLPRFSGSLVVLSPGLDLQKRMLERLGSAPGRLLVHLVSPHRLLRLTIPTGGRLPMSCQLFDLAAMMRLSDADIGGSAAREGEAE
jgi:hypothetical protein